MASSEVVPSASLRRWQARSGSSCRSGTIAAMEEVVGPQVAGAEEPVANQAPEEALMGRCRFTRQVSSRV
jgi:hypothetical protein